jgi:hypothetical protein
MHPIADASRGFLIDADPPAPGALAVGRRRLEPMGAVAPDNASQTVPCRAMLKSRSCPRRAFHSIPSRVRCPPQDKNPPPQFSPQGWRASGSFAWSRDCWRFRETKTEASAPIKGQLGTNFSTALGHPPGSAVVCKRAGMPAPPWRDPTSSRKSSLDPGASHILRPARQAARSLVTGTSRRSTRENTTARHDTPARRDRPVQTATSSRIGSA